MEGFARLNSDKILSVTYTSTAEKESLVFCIPKSKALRYRCRYKPICPSPYLYFSGSFVIFTIGCDSKYFVTMAFTMIIFVFLDSCVKWPVV